MKLFISECQWERNEALQYTFKDMKNHTMENISPLLIEGKKIQSLVAGQFQWKFFC